MQPCTPSASNRRSRWSGHCSKSSWMISVIFGCEDMALSSGRRVKAKTFVMNWCLMQDFSTSCPILPVPPVTMIFILDVSLGCDGGSVVQGWMLVCGGRGAAYANMRGGFIFLVTNHLKYVDIYSQSAAAYTYLSCFDHVVLSLYASIAHV